MPERPAPIAEVRKLIRSIRNADVGQSEDGIATSLSPGSHDRRTLLNHVRDQARLRRRTAKTQLGGIEEIDVAKKRLGELSRGEVQPLRFIEAMYGLTPEALKEIRSPLRKWSERADRPATHGAAQLSRWAFERFYRAFGLVPPRQAAARLSMTAESLSRVIKFAETTLGMLASAIGQDGIAIREDFLDGLNTAFTALRNTVFGDHSSFCHALHRALREEGVRVDAVYDFASEQVGDSTTEATYYVDVVTLRPIGLRHTVWLDFGKPMDLAPDHTSIITYAELESELTPYRTSYASVDENLLELARSIVGR